MSSYIPFSFVIYLSSYYFHFIFYFYLHLCLCLFLLRALGIAVCRIKPEPRRYWIYLTWHALVQNAPKYRSKTNLETTIDLILIASVSLSFITQLSYCHFLRNVQILWCLSGMQITLKCLFMKFNETIHHYSDVIMGATSSLITDASIVYSTVCSGADQRKYQSSASLAFVRGIHRSQVNSPHKGPVSRKMFPFDDVIMA